MPIRIIEEMNGIFTKVLRSFPVPFHRSLGLLRSYHIPKKMDSVPERELFFLFLNMYDITGKFTRLGQQIFPGVVFEIIFHPWIFIIMV